MFARALLVAAVLMLLHAAFSTYEHLSHLKALGKPEGSLPQDVIAEALLSLVIGILGASLNAPELREITWRSEMKKRKIDDVDSRLSFASWTNKGNEILGVGS
ncbi:magnesium transporter [Phellopilus nigrolimitatus]|nr:magnesium transporter [Phellopilus nigrolimitatus]